MTLSDMEGVLFELSPNDVLDVCQLNVVDSGDLIAALADYIEANQEMILENLETNGVI